MASNEKRRLFVKRRRKRFTRPSFQFLRTKSTYRVPSLLFRRHAGDDDHRNARVADEGEAAEVFTVRSPRARQIRWSTRFLARLQFQPLGECTPDCGARRRVTRSMPRMRARELSLGTWTRARSEKVSPNAARCLFTSSPPSTRWGRRYARCCARRRTAPEKCRPSVPSGDAADLWARCDAPCCRTT